MNEWMERRMMAAEWGPAFVWPVNVQHVNVRPENWKPPFFRFTFNFLLAFGFAGSKLFLGLGSPLYMSFV